MERAGTDEASGKAMLEMSEFPPFSCKRWVLRKVHVTARFINQWGEVSGHLPKGQHRALDFRTVPC